MNGRLFNNIGVCSLAIAFVVQHLDRLTLAKALLIIPLITNAELLKYLARKTTKNQTIEQLIVKKPKCFSNFNARYYDALLVSINSIQLLVEIGLLELVDGKIITTERLNYDKSMGKRAEKIFKASSNLADLVNSDIEDLYINLRVQL
ncbi:MAG: three component ABC system middle component [Candidatus Electrothrix aestuarii]|jgi:uncharacterized membrane protein YkgB|uniref:Three component ABC system middle component n=1 Tax=Candidatus Electrothrix aestuarii TaxID=3062594 RepID=A0AAU8LQS6_9BACT|nr:DUF6521 family protein [Candidatus Electrothrix aestuarii]